MSFHGFQPHNRTEDDISSPILSGDESDSGYGESTTSSSVYHTDIPSWSRSSISETPDRATYHRGTSNLDRHRSPSSKLFHI